LLYPGAAIEYNSGEIGPGKFSLTLALDHAMRFPLARVGAGGDATTRAVIGRD